MKRVKNLIVPITGVVLMVGLALNFSACTEQSPLGLNDINENVSLDKQKLGDNDFQGQYIQQYIKLDSDYGDGGE